MSDFEEALSRGEIHCQAVQNGEVVKEFTPRQAAELWVPIRIPELFESARGDFSAEYAAFAASDQSTWICACEACKTYVKFGSAMQFKQAFVVTFRRNESSDVF